MQTEPPPCELQTWDRTLRFWGDMLGILAVQLGAARGGHNQTSDRIACCCLRACITHCGDWKCWATLIAHPPTRAPSEKCTMGSKSGRERERTTKKYETMTPPAPQNQNMAWQVLCSNFSQARVCVQMPGLQLWFLFPHPCNARSFSVFCVHCRKEPRRGDDGSHQPGGRKLELAEVHLACKYVRASFVVFIQRLVSAMQKLAST